MHQSVLSYGEFVTYIRENVESVLADDRETEVVLSEIAKNNGVMSEIMTNGFRRQLVFFCGFELIL